MSAISNGQQGLVRFCCGTVQALLGRVLSFTYRNISHGDLLLTNASIDSRADASSVTTAFPWLPLSPCSGNIPLNSEVAAAAGAYTYSLSQNSSTTLDLIRVISAQLVLIGHGLVLFDIATRFSPIQDLGVLMFFLLSGLLITYSTFRKKNSSDYGFRVFLIERFSRIYSGYLPSICVIVLLDVLFIHKYGQNEYHYVLDTKAFFGNIFMLQDFPLLGPITGITSLGSARPFWTLSVEWWFYMFFGFVVLIKSSESRRGLYATLLTALAVVPFFNSVVAGRGNGLFAVWMMGFLVAVVLNGSAISISPRRCAIVVTLCVVCGFLRAYNARTMYDLTLAGCLAGSLFFMARGLDQAERVYTPAILRVITFMANYSFSLYLIHYSILVLLVPLKVSMSPYLLFAGGIVGANVIAALLALPTEMRHRQLTRRLIKIFS